MEPQTVVMKKVLIVGVGNILMGDDGVGPYVVNRIVDSGCILPEDVEVMDGGTAGLDLLHAMQGREKVIIVDALNVDDRPGSVYRFGPENLRPAANRMSLHEVGVRETIRVLRMMGENPKVEIVGIVPERISECGIGISCAVRESVPRAIEVILEAAAH